LKSQIAFCVPQTKSRSLIGLIIALGLPMLAVFEAHVRADLSDTDAAITLAAVPWLTLAWVVLGERQTLASIGIRSPSLDTLGFGLLGAIVNFGISATIAKFNLALGLKEIQSALMTQLVEGDGWLLVIIVTNGAVLTEIVFRGYVIERLSSLTNGNLWIVTPVQFVMTTSIFIAARGLAHGMVWAVDDVVFTLFYFWRRDTLACLLAHALPNFVASTLVAMGAMS